MAKTIGSGELGKAVNDLVNLLGSDTENLKKTGKGEATLKVKADTTDAVKGMNALIKELKEIDELTRNMKPIGSDTKNKFSAVQINNLNKLSVAYDKVRTSISQAVEVSGGDFSKLDVSGIASAVASLSTLISKSGAQVGRFFGTDLQAIFSTGGLSSISDLTSDLDKFGVVMDSIADVKLNNVSSFLGAIERYKSDSYDKVQDSLKDIESLKLKMDKINEAKNEGKRHVNIGLGTQPIDEAVAHVQSKYDELYKTISGIQQLNQQYSFLPIEAPALALLEEVNMAMEKYRGNVETVAKENPVEAQVQGEEKVKEELNSVLKVDEQILEIEKEIEQLRSKQSRLRETAMFSTNPYGNLNYSQLYVNKKGAQTGLEDYRSWTHNSGYGAWSEIRENIKEDDISRETIRLGQLAEACQKVGITFAEMAQTIGGGFDQYIIEGALEKYQQFLAQKNSVYSDAEAKRAEANEMDSQISKLETQKALLEEKKRLEELGVTDVEKALAVYEQILNVQKELKDLSKKKNNWDTYDVKKEIDLGSYRYVAGAKNLIERDLTEGSKNVLSLFSKGKGINIESDEYKSIVRFGSLISQYMEETGDKISKVKTLLGRGWDVQSIQTCVDLFKTYNDRLEENKQKLLERQKATEVQPLIDEKTNTYHALQEQYATMTDPSAIEKKAEAERKEAEAAEQAAEAERKRAEAQAEATAKDEEAAAAKQKNAEETMNAAASATPSKEGMDKEAEAAEKVKTNMQLAAEAKEAFAKANKTVASSTGPSAEGISQEYKSLQSLLKTLASIEITPDKLNPATITELITALNSLNSGADYQSLINFLTKLNTVAGKAEGVGTLAASLKDLGKSFVEVFNSTNGTEALNSLGTTLSGLNVNKNAGNNIKSVVENLKLLVGFIRENEGLVNSDFFKSINQMLSQTGSLENLAKILSSSAKKIKEASAVVNNYGKGGVQLPAVIKPMPDYLQRVYDDYVPKTKEEEQAKRKAEQEAEKARKAAEKAAQAEQRAAEQRQKKADQEAKRAAKEAEKDQKEAARIAAADAKKGTPITDAGTFSSAMELYYNLEKVAQAGGLGTILSKDVNEKTGIVTARLRDVNGELKNIQVSLDSTNIPRWVSTGLKPLAFLQNSLKGLGKQLMSFIGYKFTITAIWGYFRNGINVLKEFDKALTSISYTMNISKKDLKDLGDTVVDMASKYSTSISNAAEVAQIYANMNTTAKEIENLSKPTLVLSNLASINASEAADEIQGVVQQFNIAAEQSEHIVDVYDKISSSIAVDYSKGIKNMAEGVQVVGDTARQAGLSFEQLSAIIAKVSERTRMDGNSISAGLKTIMVRTSKVGELSDEVDNETMSKASASLNEIGIAVYNLDGSYREFDEIMKDLSKVWGDLTDAQQANVCLVA